MIAFNNSYTGDIVIAISEIRIQRRIEIFLKIEETILVQHLMIVYDSNGGSIFIY